MTIYERLKKARKKKKISQLQAATKLNVTQATISKYESGHLEPSLEMFKNMLILYEANANEILGIPHRK